MTRVHSIAYTALYDTRCTVKTAFHISRRLKETTCQNDIHQTKKAVLAGYSHAWLNFVVTDYNLKPSIHDGEYGALGLRTPSE